MNSSRLKQINTSPAGKYSIYSGDSIHSPIQDNKENFYKNGTFSSSPIRKNTWSASDFVTNDNKLDMELHKILVESFNSPNKENNAPSTMNYGIRDSKNYRSKEVDKNTNIRSKLMELRQMPLRVNDSAIFDFDEDPNGLIVQLIEKNHHLINRLNEIQKQIALYKVKRNDIIDKVLKSLGPQQESQSAHSTDVNKNVVADGLQLLFLTTNQNHKEILQHGQRNAASAESLFSYSE